MFVRTYIVSNVHSQSTNQSMLLDTFCKIVLMYAMMPLVLLALAVALVVARRSSCSSRTSGIGSPQLSSSHTQYSPLPSLDCDDHGGATTCDVAPGHLYLIREREFIRTNELVFKIGKSTNIRNRMPCYPKNSQLHAILLCPYNVHATEKALIKRFDKVFVKRTDIGKEYYHVPTVRRVTSEFIGFLISRIH